MKLMMVEQTQLNAVQPGDAVPDVVLYEDTPGGKVNLKELIGSKKAVIFGVPGAFTPGCSKTHLPGYVESADKLKEAGVEVIACVSVNDPFVMSAIDSTYNNDDKDDDLLLLLCNMRRPPEQVFMKHDIGLQSLSGWGEAHGAAGKVRMLADMHLDLTKALDVELDATPFLGNSRCKRFSVIFEDGKVTQFFLEPDGTGLTCSLADNALKALTK